MSVNSPGYADAVADVARADALAHAVDALTRARSDLDGARGTESEADADTAYNAAESALLHLLPRTWCQDFRAKKIRPMTVQSYAQFAFGATARVLIEADLPPPHTRLAGRIAAQSCGPFFRVVVDRCALRWP